MKGKQCLTQLVVALTVLNIVIFFIIGTADLYYPQSSGSRQSDEMQELCQNRQNFIGQPVAIDISLFYGLYSYRPCQGPFVINLTLLGQTLMVLQAFMLGYISKIQKLQKYKMQEEESVILYPEEEFSDEQQEEKQRYYPVMAPLGSGIAVYVMLLGSNILLYSSSSNYIIIFVITFAIISTIHIIIYIKPPWTKFLIVVYYFLFAILNRIISGGIPRFLEILLP